MLAATLVAFGGTPAHAAMSVRVFNTGGAGIAARSLPTMGSVTGYGAPENGSATTICWTWGDSVGPNGNRLWWLISYAGRTFYANDRYLTTPNIANQPPASEPRCGATLASAPTPAYKPAVWVGSPISGTWSAPGGEGPDQHHTMANTTDDADFAVDLRANADQPVYLYAAPVKVTNAIDAKVEWTGPSCSGGGGGSAVQVGFYYKGQRLGYAAYAHLNLARPFKTGDTLNRWKTLLGTVGSGYAVDPACWTGPHVHFELWATSPNYACYNRTLGLGASLALSNFLGSTGGTTNTNVRQACP